MDLIATLEQEEIARLNRTIPDFAPGDTVIVSVNVVEGTRKRIQAYEGVVIAKRNRSLKAFSGLHLAEASAVQENVADVRASVANDIELTFARVVRRRFWRRVHALHEVGAHTFIERVFLLSLRQSGLDSWIHHAPFFFLSYSSAPPTPFAASLAAAPHAAAFLSPRPILSSRAPL